MQKSKCCGCDLVEPPESAQNGPRAAATVLGYTGFILAVIGTVLAVLAAGSSL